jgi:arginine repressor
VATCPAILRALRRQAAKVEAAADRLDERGCDVGVVGLIAFDDADLMVFREPDDTGDMVTQVHDLDDVAKDG